MEIEEIKKKQNNIESENKILPESQERGTNPNFLI